MTHDTPLPAGFPRLEKQTRPWSCKKDDETCTRQKPCNSCRGARSRRSGMRKQREARKALEALTGAEAARFAGQLGNEESWALGVRVEAKSGAQVGPIATRFLAAEKQSAGSKATGDTRAFAMVAMPTGWGSDGIVLCRLTELGRLVEGLLEVT